MIHLTPSAGIPSHYANRHALITGPTGTGKTISLMRLAESFISQGVPVFAPDVKGDLSALTRSCPTTHWQPLSGPGTPARIPVWGFGADLLSRALELTDAQSGALEVAFAYADETGMPLDTLPDLRALLAALASQPDSVAHLGHITRASIGTIQRALLRLDKGGANSLFGPLTFDVAALLDPVKLHLLDASQLYHSPRLYGAFLLFVLRDLAQRLPECGDLDKPRLVLVFDEAHTVFHEASPALLRSVEATARLIRSKGVGLYWASQSPDDIPLVIRAQCATTIRHERSFGVGRAAFITLDSAGRITPERMITPDMPTCPLGPLAGDEVPATPEPDEPATAQPGDAIGYAFLLFTLLVIGALIWTVFAGYGWHMAALGAGAYLVARPT